MFLNGRPLIGRPPLKDSGMNRLIGWGIMYGVLYLGTVIQPFPFIFYNFLLLVFFPPTYSFKIEKEKKNALNASSRM